MPENSPPLERPEPSLCTNPLSWRVDEELAPATMGQGAVVPVAEFNSAFGKTTDLATGQRFTRLPQPVTELTWAQCREGTLYVENQQGNAFEAKGADDLGTYHRLDYALFYMDIHNNVIQRTNRFLSQKNPD